MSVQFGRWNFEGQSAAPASMEKVSAVLAPYGPDSNESYSKGGIRILYHSFHTTKESRCEKQPYISQSGTVITWDGRLDNRADLINELRDSLTIEAADVAIVAASYEKWGKSCLRKLIGDWALSIWNPRDVYVLLAKDPVGTRHLYYSFCDKNLIWSSILDPLILFGDRTFEICEEYIAGWFSYFPDMHLTPYLGIRAVPPSSYVLLRPGKHAISKYWDFAPHNKIHYRTDGEYEEHFRTVLAQAVQRRLRSDRPILAELSGGLDSASILCMADTLITRGAAEDPHLDTISWFDASDDHIERDSNELHWITKIEERRGRIGLHIDLASIKRDASSQESFASKFGRDGFAATPMTNLELSEHSKRYAALMFSHGYRVTLSGIGGDEVTFGGVPTPTPELQNLLARGRFLKLARQLNAWAMKMRRPRTLLLREAVRGFFSRALTGVSIDMRPAPWLHSGFICRNYAALSGYPTRVKVLGPLPSYQENMVILNVLRRLLSHWALQPKMLREIRFPYLDRDFLEFLYAIPREQIVGVGKRRFLMKRALAGIVPDDLLNRRRSWAVHQESTPEPKKDSEREWHSFAERGQQIVSDSIGIIDSNCFLAALQKTRDNDEVLTHILRRTLGLESWLRHLTSQGVLKSSMPTKNKNYSRRFGQSDKTIVAHQGPNQSDSSRRNKSLVS
jgi:asparagine synthase (glutamine-hydrolysing)